MCLYSRSILNVSLIGISGQFMFINSYESHIPVSGKQRITRIYVLKRERQATWEKTATRDLKVICLRHPPIKQVTTFSVVSSLTPEPQAWEYSTRSGASLRFVQGFRERPCVVPAPGVVFWSMRVELNHCHSCVNTRLHLLRGVGRAVFCHICMVSPKNRESMFEACPSALLGGHNNSRGSCAVGSWGVEK